MANMFRLYPLQWNDTADGCSHNEELTSSLVNNTDGSEELGGEAAPVVHHQGTDNVWRWIMLCSYAGVLIAACTVQFYRNANFDSLISKDSLWDPNTCPLVPSPAAHRKLQGAFVTNDDYLRFESSVLNQPWWLLLWAVATLAATIAATTVLLRIFEAKAQGMVRSIAFVLIVAPLVTGIAVMALGGPTLAFILLLVMGVANVTCFTIWSARLSRLGRLISIASAAISDNPNLFWVAVKTQVALVFMYLFQAYYLFSVSRVGTVAPNPLAKHVQIHGSDSCIDSLTKEKTPCCIWSTAPWTFTIQFPGIFVFAWICSWILETQTFIIASTVYQWYFAPVSRRGSSRQSIVSSNKQANSAMGTLALAGLVLWWVRLFRTFTYVNDRRLKWRNPLTYLCGFITIPYCCICWCFSPCVEHITKYATHRAAMTGHDFYSSSSEMFSILRRNHLNAIGMGWLPPFILRYAALALGLTVGLATGALVPSGPSAFFTGDIAFATVLLILTPAGLLLLTVLDSLYLCFALDRDQQQCTHNELHDIFTQAPAFGPLWDDDTQAGLSDGMVLGVPATMHAACADGQQQYAAPPAQHLPQPAAV